jgi:hypothetical protein
MAMEQMPPEGAPPEAAADGGAPQPGGAAQLVAGIHTDLMKLSELVGSKFPEEGEALNAIISQYQSFADGLGGAPGAQGPSKMPGTTTPEAGANPNAVPMMS